MANRIFQRYNSLLNEATSLEQYYSKSYITGLQQTFINLQPNQYWMYDGIDSFLEIGGFELYSSATDNEQILNNVGVNPKFCVNAKLRCKIEQKCFKAGAAQAAAAFSTKITALRGDVKGGGVSLRSSRLLTFRLQPVSPACGRQRTPLTVRELRSSPAAFRSTSS